MSLEIARNSAAWRATSREAGSCSRTAEYLSTVFPILLSAELARSTRARRGVPSSPSGRRDSAVLVIAASSVAVVSKMLGDTETETTARHAHLADDDRAPRLPPGRAPPLRGQRRVRCRRCRQVGVTQYEVSAQAAWHSNDQRDFAAALLNYSIPASLLPDDPMIGTGICREYLSALGLDQYIRFNH